MAALGPTKEIPRQSAWHECCYVPAMRSTRRGSSSFTLFLAAASVGFSLLWMPSPARACSPIRNDPHVLEASSDAVPPGAVTATVESVSLAEDEGPDDGDCSSTSHVVLRVSSSDDQTPDLELGYQLTSIRGDALGVPTSPVRATDGEVHLSWVSSGEERIDAVVGVQAVDLAGNMGPMQEVSITGEAPAGCSISPRSGFGSSAGPLVALALLAFRRRARLQRRP